MDLTTDFLIVGCGPAGASLACFLGSHGLTGIVIGAASGTADTPRAHITNMAALECLRDIGLEREVERVASRSGCMEHTRWCYSMAGVEFARVYAWGHDPRRMGDYALASPCTPADVPQTLLEPILIRYATQHGFHVRFDTKLTAIDIQDETIQATVLDTLSHSRYRIQARYLLAADGARSLVVRELDLPLRKRPGQGTAYNVLVRADMEHLVRARSGNLHWVVRPDVEGGVFAAVGIVRMVRTWDEWIFILFPGREGVDPSEEQCWRRVRLLIGDETPFEVVGVSKWQINHVVAESFCLGDAVHRHPPMNGLGSNTCIQDAYNLAWKLALVHKGQAGHSLLETYDAERQPVGVEVVSRANQAFKDHARLWAALGVTSTEGDGARALQELVEVGERGERRRRELRLGVEETTAEFHGLGVEMGQRYCSEAIFDADEPEPWKAKGRAAEDPVRYYEPGTYPGSRLPHAWLNKAIPAKATSTLDVAGHGRFVLLTGVGGSAWKTEAEKVSATLGVEMEAVSIGFRQDWEDVYFEWERVRGVGRGGCVGQA
ncbi:putative 2,4-dichlorophenol 6-monooxygenase [Ophiocordyceps camponoti-floridani]|uniref:Putative 2,4-dichlorophenol 6-monooxygenase n=1 Tax=Ophiocordyceps camponoti-floridani TaxID=2030778 RepID=A0A8H4VBS3_9HYPO|nr:putative 2,4-dichlorophenol 6-monooxygenase [Ophiocordyceps camponoti-floridani]